MKEDSFEYCLLFVLAVVVATVETIVKNCSIMLSNAMNKTNVEPLGAYDLMQRGYTSALNTGIYPVKPRLSFDLEVQAIERLRVIRYLDRFSTKDLRAECKLGRVNVKGCKTKASVIAEMVWQLMDDTGIGATELCSTVRNHYDFMKGRENG